mmetsp:Transcript_26452/g.85074  ORF Transcript_26452/g.85074 Transcript_26452/m.85074 type:complete len:93 (-) Transcript_26452:242-520(-)
MHSAEFWPSSVSVAMPLNDEVQFALVSKAYVPGSRTMRVAVTSSTAKRSSSLELTTRVGGGGEGGGGGGGKRGKRGKGTRATDPRDDPDYRR